MVGLFWCATGQASEDYLGQAPALERVEHAARRRSRKEFRPQSQVSDRGGEGEAGRGGGVNNGCGASYAPFGGRDECGWCG